MLRRTRRRPRIRTQIELERFWQRRLRRIGRDQWGLSCLFIGPMGFATRKVVNFSDILGPLDYGTQERFVRWLRAMVEDVPGRWRVAMLITRPGDGVVVRRDVDWAATLYDAARTANVAGEVVHLSAGRQIVPLPLDALPDPAVGF